MNDERPPGLEGTLWVRSTPVALVAHWLQDYDYEADATARVQQLWDDATDALFQGRPATMLYPSALFRRRC